MIRLADLKIAEADLHKTVADLLDWTLPPPVVWTTFPAGWGKLGKATAGSLHGCGLKAGMPDILVFYASYCIGIELKAPGGRVSKDQAEMFPRLEAAGVAVYVCYSADDVIWALRQANIPMRSMEISA